MPETTTLRELKATEGFKEAPKTAPKRLIASVSGLPKTGKTHFALTAPEPIIYINMDYGLEGVIQKFADKEILVYSAARISKGSSDKAVYEPIWAGLKEILTKAWSLGEGTVIVDTASELWELARLAHFGKLAQVMPTNYSEVNKELREFIRLAYSDDNPMNTVFIHKLKAKYRDNVKTSEYEIAGFGDMEYNTQVNVRMFREDGEGGSVFRALIEDCRKEPSMNGVVLTPPEPVTFEHLLDRVHAKTAGKKGKLLTGKEGD